MRRKTLSPYNFFFFIKEIEREKEELEGECLGLGKMGYMAETGKESVIRERERAMMALFGF